MTSISLVELLGLAESTFSIRVRSFDRFRPSRLRNNVTVHSFQTAQGDKQLGDAIFLAISDWLNDRGWTLSRWRVDKAPYKGREYVLIAPVEVVRLATAYHATRSASIDSIRQNGLCGGTRERCNTDRLDTLGNSYVCLELGSPGDESRGECGTANWWREHLRAKTAIMTPIGRYLSLTLAVLRALHATRTFGARAESSSARRFRL